MRMWIRSSSIRVARFRASSNLLDVIGPRIRVVSRDPINQISSLAARLQKGRRHCWRQSKSGFCNDKRRRSLHTSALQNSGNEKKPSWLQARESAPLHPRLARPGRFIVAAQLRLMVCLPSVARRWHPAVSPACAARPRSRRAFARMVASRDNPPDACKPSDGVLRATQPPGSPCIPSRSGIKISRGSQ